MANFLIWVNSYNRKNMLLSLIEDIQRESGDHKVDLMVVNDCSDQDYSIIKKKSNFYWKTKYHYGREGYWKIIKFAMAHIKILRGSYDCFIKTDDDMRLIDNFFDISYNLWNNLKDPKKATLDILSYKKQRGKTLFGNSASIVSSTYKYYRTQWVDMNFIFDPDAFPVNIGPCKSSKASSGVGLWLTRYFNKNGYNLYQSSFSLVLHGNHESQMNKEERKKHKIITRVSE